MFRRRIGIGLISLGKVDVLGTVLPGQAVAVGRVGSGLSGTLPNAPGRAVCLHWMMNFPERGFVALGNLDERWRRTVDSRTVAAELWTDSRTVDSLSSPLAKSVFWDTQIARSG